jgi:2',3'-cyclic-nucleotide 2'-phosphodiesterase (5'-nucleotidase family)
MIILVIFIVLLVVWGVLKIYIARTGSPEPIPDGARISIFATSSLGGYGGPIKSLATLIAERNRTRPVLLVDTGDFCSSDGNIPDEMRLLSYKAAGIGPGEIRYGGDRLLTGARETGLDLLSANIRDRQSGRLIGKPWKVVRLGDIEVGLFSVMPNGNIGEVDPDSRDRYEVTDIRMAAFEAVEELEKRRCDLILAFGQLGIEACTRLVSEVPGIDIIISGLDPPKSPRGIMKGSSLIVETSAGKGSPVEINVTWKNGLPVMEVVEN